MIFNKFQVSFINETKKAEENLTRMATHVKISTIFSVKIIHIWEFIKSVVNTYTCRQNKYT